MKNQLIIQSLQKDIKLEVKKARPPVTIKPTSQSHKTRRSNITRFSPKSQRRFKLLLRNTMHLMRCWIVLTYPANYPNDGRKIKHHIQKMRQWLQRRGHQIVWLLEFQQRGAPHLNILSTKSINIQEIKQYWHELIGHNVSLNTGVSVSTIYNHDGLILYLLKKSQKKVPISINNVGRFWGYTRDLSRYSEHIIIESDDIKSLFRLMRIYRKWYERKLKSWGYHQWKFKNRGFIAWEGARLVNFIRSQKIPGMYDVLMKPIYEKMYLILCQELETRKVFNSTADEIIKKL